MSSTVVANLIYIYIIKLEIGRFFTELLSMWKAVAVSVLVGFAIMKGFIINGWVSFIGLVICFSALYATIFVLLAFNDNEKNMLKNAVMKFRRA